jgi:putative MATE family efflux protein
MAMRVLILANSINIVLAPFLIFGWGPFPELGVTGAAVAITIGRGTGALFALSRLVWGRGRIVLRRELAKFEPDIMWKLVRVSATGTLQMFIGMASWIGLVRILSGFGSEALAGYTIGIRWIIFALAPSWGMGGAAATLVGQSLGAGKPERAEEAVWKAGFYNACFLGAVGLVFIFGGRQIVGQFAPDAAVLEYGADALKIISYGFLLYGYGMVITQAFNGAGDTWTPTYINLFVFWLFEIPLAYLLAHKAGLGPHGVFWAITAAFSILAIISGIIFKQGRWKTQQV